MTALSIDTQRPPTSTVPLYWMALGAFAIGTESFMVAAILPDIAIDLGVAIGTAGQLVTAFALTYAVTSPVLTILTGRVARRRLLIGCMVAFAAANVAAALSTSYPALLGARVLLAAAAGLYVPNANALAGMLVSPDRRGRALAIVTGGLSLAVALGVPTGALVGGHFGWRMTFVLVGVLSAVAVLGLAKGVPGDVGAGFTPASLQDRLTALRRPGMLSALLVTTLWAVGGFAVYTYLAMFLAEAAGLRQAGIGVVLFAWGAAAFAGLIVGGRATDRFGAQTVIAVTLPLTAVALMVLSFSSDLLTPRAALVPVMMAVVAWGAAAWAFFPAQQARLIALTDLRTAPVILSLNASFQYIGFALGAALGAFVLTHGTSADLGWAGGACMMAAGLLNARPYGFTFPGVRSSRRGLGKRRGGP